MGCLNPPLLPTKFIEVEYKECYKMASIGGRSKCKYASLRCDITGYEYIDKNFHGILYYHW